MKERILLLFTAILTTTIITAQSNYDVDIKTPIKTTKYQFGQQNKREAFGNCKFIYTFDFKEGDRFIFEKSESAIKDGYDFGRYFLTKEFKKSEDRRTRLLQKDYAGKIIKIIKIEEIKSIVFPDTYFTFLVEETGEQISCRTIFKRLREKEKLDKDLFVDDNYSLRYLIYLPDIDSLRSIYLNKTFFTKFVSLNTFKQYQPVKIIRIGASSDYAYPIRIVFEDALGKEDYKDVCTCGNNLSLGLINLFYIENFFTLVDPKKNFKGSEESWDLIIQKAIKVGFTEEELLLSLGNPSKINETLVSGSLSKQYVYNNKYVYVDNGIVSSIQSSR